MSKLEERIDALAISYLENHYDIKKMTPKEYLEKFNEISKELFAAYQNAR